MGFSGTLLPLHLLGDFLGVLNTTLTIVLVSVHPQSISVKKKKNKERSNRIQCIKSGAHRL